MIILFYLGLSQDRQSYRGNRAGVVVGDGSLVATAAHCVEDFAEASRQSILARPLVVSAYYGDVFEAELVGVNSAADLAVLRIRWNGHPAMLLAEERELAKAQEMLVASYPPSEKVSGRPVSSRQVSSEQLPVLQLPGPSGEDRIILGGARFIGPGWSGAPMILPETGRLAGIFSRKEDLRLGDLVVLENRLGGSVRALQLLMNTQRVALSNSPAPAATQEGAADAFSAALGWLDSQAGGSPQEGVTAAETFVQRRPNSARSHLFLALSSAGLFFRNPKDLSAAEKAEQHYSAAARLDPASPLIHAAYGAYLDGRKRPEEALVQLDKATRIDPGNSFVQAMRLKILADLRPEEAEALGRQLVSASPDNAAYWFHYAGALRKLGRMDDALKAAQTAVALASKEQVWYQGRLADLLAKSGRLEAAEACYRVLLEDRPKSPVFWSWYAQFLAERQPQRTADLRRALDQWESFNQPPTVPQKLLDDLRARLAPGAGKDTKPSPQ